MKTAKLLSLLLAIIMVLGLGVTAFADDGIIVGGNDEEFTAELALESYFFNRRYSGDVHPGGYRDLTLNLKFRFKGDGEVYNNFKLKYLLLDDTNFTMVDNKGTVITREEIDYPLEADAEETANKFVCTPSIEGIHIRAGSNTLDGTYPLQFTAVLEYEESGTLMRSVVQLAPVLISVKDYVIEEEPDDEEEEKVPPILTPHLVITGFSTAGAELTGDENIGFSVKFKNTSRDVAIQNIIVTISTPEGVSMPFASNNFYVEKVDPLKEGNISFTIKGKKDIPEGVIPLGLSFNYEYYYDESYRSGSDNEMIGLSFGEGDEETEKKDRFELSSIELPDYMLPGEENYLTLTVINKGKEELLNVQAKVESEGLSNSGASEYYGLMDVNKKAEIELPIVAMNGGELHGQVIISYELSDGTEKTLTRDFTAFVEEPYMGGIDEPWEDPGIYEPIPETPAFPWWGYALIGAGVIGVVVLIVVLKKRAAKKKQALLDAEDADEE